MTEPIQSLSAAMSALSLEGCRWLLGKVWAEIMAPEEQCFLDWQNQSRTVPSIKATPAGMPMMTGQGRLGGKTDGIGENGGFGSG